MPKKANQELKIAVESIRIAIISLAITLALSIFPLSISLMKPEVAWMMTILVILFLLCGAVFLTYLALKIKSPK